MFEIESIINSNFVTAIKFPILSEKLNIFIKKNTPGDIFYKVSEKDNFLKKHFDQNTDYMIIKDVKADEESALFLKTNSDVPEKVFVKFNTNNDVLRNIEDVETYSGGPIGRVNLNSFNNRQLNNNSTRFSNLTDDKTPWWKNPIYIASIIIIIVILLFIYKSKFSKGKSKPKYTFLD